MWRLFRLGVKSFYGPGQGQIRIVSTTTLSSDAENLDDEADVFGNLAENAKINEFPLNETLANKASKLYGLHSPKNDHEVGTNIKLLHIEKLLKEVQWKNYLDNRTRIFSSNDADSTKTVSDNCSLKKHKEIPEKKLDSNSAEVAFKEENDHDEKKFLEVGMFEPDFPSDENAGDEIYGKRLKPQEYGQKMLQLCRERKLVEALEVLEKEMVLQKIAPNRYCYTVLINACGKAGYSFKAFKLLNQMKKRGVKVEEHVYTGLFDACANSPDKCDGLKRATKLRKQIKDKNVVLNFINYHAMIKAFGHCGDIGTAFEIADELIEVGHNVTTITMNFLLQACISDKESGFRHAIMVWRKMRSLNLRPSIFTYSLLMRCVRECKAGDPNLFSELLERPKRLKDNPRFIKKQNESKSAKSQQFLSSGDIDSWLYSRKENISSKADSAKENTESSIGIIDSSNIELLKSDKSKKYDALIPNVLSEYYIPGKIEGISSLDTACERFAFLGGSQGVLFNMKQDRVKPTMAIFTQMLDSLPNMREAEEALVSTMESSDMKFDSLFFNMLLKRRNVLKRYKDGGDVIRLMQSHHIAPDLTTFQCLAVGCVKLPQAIGLIRDMKRAGIRLDEPVMSSLIHSSIRNKDYLYTLEILRNMKRYNIAPSERTLLELEEVRKQLRKFQLEKEREYFNKGPMPEREQLKMDEIRLFLLEYKTWLKKSHVELNDHPWTQYGYDKRIVQN